MPNPAPREAFIAGHNLAYCATYFDQVLMAANLDTQVGEARQHAQQMVQMLQRVGPNFAARLRHIKIIGQEAGLSLDELPAMPEEFARWVALTHSAFVHFWPAKADEGWVFMLGHSIGELRNGLIVLTLLLDFESNLSIEPAGIDRIPERLTAAVERLNQAQQVLRDGPLAQDVGEPPQILLKLPTVLSALNAGERGKAIAAELARRIIPELATTERELLERLPSAWTDGAI